MDIERKSKEEKYLENFEMWEWWRREDRSKKIKIEQVLGRMGEERAILKTSERKGIDLQEAVYKEE